MVYVCIGPYINNILLLLHSEMNYGAGPDLAGGGPGAQP